jgi:CelD/BcsL family acetyltransferase involved in cellulose biosynthesis
MNLAIRIDTAHHQGEPDIMSGAKSIARVEIFNDMAMAEPAWRQLERDDTVKTPYQSFDLLASWQSHLGSQIGVTPFIVAGYDTADRPAFLLPLGTTRTGPVTIASFLGGKHVNFNLGLWRRDILQNFTADDIRALISRIAASHQIDILSLLNQPRSWEGITNPLALLPHQDSPSGSLRLTIDQKGEELIKQLLSPSVRSRLGGKRRKLQRLRGYQYVRATTPSDVKRLLDAFFPLKSAHMKIQALPDIFADPAHEAFLRDACTIGLAAGKPLIEIHALEGDGELLAFFAAINDGNRCSGMFNTYTMSDHSKQSPGVMLLIDLISDLADRDVRVFDLGVGEAKYKTAFCKEPEPLFDSYLPLTALGKLAAFTASASGRVKRQIKQSSFLWTMFQTLRQGLGAKQV